MSNIEFPSADAVAVALCAAASETGEDPVECLYGEYGLHCRHYAAHALKRVFPSMLTSTLARVVGSGSPHSFWTQSNRCALDGTFKWWSPATARRVELRLRTFCSRASVKSGPLCARRKPAAQFRDVTADLMGDPPRERSALAAPLAEPRGTA